MKTAQNKSSQMNHRPPGRPRRVDSEQRVDTSVNILEQARILFATRGFSGVSINDIVAAAEVSKPTLYYYFPDKETLYAAVLIDIIEQAGQAFQPLLEQSIPLRKKLIVLSEGFFTHAPISLTCLLRDATQHLNEPLSGQVLTLYRSKIYQPFETLLQTGIDRGELKPVQDIWLLTELFLTIMDCLALRFAFHEGSSPPLKENAAQVVALFLEGAGTQPT